MPAPEKNTDERYRFRNRLPQPGEGKAPRAELQGVVEGEIAKIRLYDVIDSWGGFWGVSASEFTEALDTIGDTVTEIRVHINSPGGEVYEAIAILNALRAHPARVVAIVDGLAASAASFIACGVDETIMGENTELMIHDAHAVAIGPAAFMREAADRLDQVSDNIASIYAKKSGTDLAGWRAAMLAETWYSADEAVDAGLADRAGELEDEGDPVEIEKDDAEPFDDFNLASFKYQGRDNAPAPAAARVEGTPARDERAKRMLAHRHAENARRAG